MLNITNSIIVKEAIIHIGAMRQTLKGTLTFCIVRKLFFCFPCIIIISHLDVAHNISQAHHFAFIDQALLFQFLKIG